MSVEVTSPTSRGTDRRTAILEAVLRVLGEHGLEAVTHRTVAREAGVPLAATTYWFASKAEMVEEALAHAAQAEMARVAERIGALADRERSPAEWAGALTAWLEEQLAGDGRRRLTAQYLLQLRAARSPRLRAICADWNARDVAFARELLAGAGSADPARDAASLVAAIDGLRLNLLSSRDEGLDEAEVRAQLERLIAVLTSGV